MQQIFIVEIHIYYNRIKCCGSIIKLLQYCVVLPQFLNCCNNLLPRHLLQQSARTFTTIYFIAKVVFCNDFRPIATIWTIAKECFPCSDFTFFNKCLPIYQDIISKDNDFIGFPALFAEATITTSPTFVEWNDHTKQQLSQGISVKYQYHNFFSFLL